MDRETADKFVKEANEKGIVVNGDGLIELFLSGTIDGMDPNEWLEAMTMD